MIIVPFLLLLLGLFLIFMEFYLPGGIMGVAGGVLIVISIIHFANQRDSLWEIMGFVLLAAVSVGLLIRFTLWHIQHTKPGNGIYSWGNQTGYRASHYDQETIGKEGVVSSDLKPGGHVVIEGKTRPAVSLAGYLPKGTSVIVVSGEGDTLFVKSKE